MTAFRALPGVSSHARERCRDHHGFDLTDAEWLSLWLDIADGKAVLVRRNVRDGDAIYAARVPGREAMGPLLLAYVERWAHIVTTLPPEAARTRARHHPRRWNRQHIEGRAVGRRGGEEEDWG